MESETIESASTALIGRPATTSPVARRDRPLAVERRPGLVGVAARGLVRGMAGGVIATAAMSALMLGAQKAGLMGQMPPTKITNSMLGALGIRRKTPEPAKKALAVLTHFAFGGACGALFGAASAVAHERSRSSPLARDPRLATLAGVLYGSAIWATSYAGWVPAFGIMPRPENDRPGRPTSMVLAHWVFGAVLAKVAG